MATTEWVSKAAKEYEQYLRAKQLEDNARIRREDIERVRLNRIATEGPEVGQKLWASLQHVINSDVAEFNETFGGTALRTKALGNGTFEIHFSERGTTDKIATLAYAPDTTVLSWKIYGGSEGTPLRIGIQPGTDMQFNNNRLEFTNGSSFPGLEKISQMIITNLLP